MKCDRGGPATLRSAGATRRRPAALQSPRAASPVLPPPHPPPRATGYESPPPPRPAPPPPSANLSCQMQVNLARPSWHLHSSLILVCQSWTPPRATPGALPGYLPGDRDLPDLGDLRDIRGLGDFRGGCEHRRSRRSCPGSGGLRGCAWVGVWF